MDIIEFRRRVDTELIGAGLSEMDRFALCASITHLALVYAEDFTRGILKDLRNDGVL